MAGEDVDLAVAVGQRDDELHQEAVQLRLGQPVGALVLHRVLRRRDEERLRQRARRAFDGDLPFLHRLEQCGLRLRRGAVDLVGEQQVGEHRAVVELEPRGAGVVHQRSRDVTGHQVRGELHAFVVQRERRREGADEQCLRDTRDAFEQHVATAEQRDDQPGDDGVLPDDGLRDLGADGGQRGARVVLGDAASAATAWGCHCRRISSSS